MQKHSRKQDRDNKRRQNANFRLPESAHGIVQGILGFLDSESFASGYLLSEYLSKLCLPDAAAANARRDAAILKWKASEAKNARTNAYLRGMDRGYNIMPRVTFYRFLEFAQRLTSDILGPLTDEVVVGKFSGGASTSRSRASSTPAEKFIGQADVTKGVSPYVDLLHHVVPLLRQERVFYDLREVDGALLFTVPKKTDIDRCACKEPDVNMFLQKGVGGHIRRRLRRFGINLNDQTINQRLARQGSIDNSICTIDLSSASDSVTKSCVEALLPPDWFLYLNDIRSQKVGYEGHFVETEMFSSMGNGFTFELESLIFFVLMKTVAYFGSYRGVVSVYGDDIIVPSGMFDMASFVLSEFGFSLNMDKTFADGPFRESCGGHYHCGVDVTPFYLRRPVTRLTDVIRVANQLRRWAFADEYRRYEYPEVYQAWLTLRAFVPQNLWGGRDYEVDTQLVTPDSPRKRLVRVRTEKKVSHLGQYLAWHNTNWNRSSEPEEIGYGPVQTETFCWLRTAIPGALTIDMFSEEY